MFGAIHAKALEELRTAHIALAQAWAKSHVDSVEEDNTDAAGGPELTKTASKSAATNAPDTTTGGPNREAQPETGTAADVLAPGAVGDKTRDAGESQESTRSRLDVETEADIAAARKRREANARFFEAVRTGVKDVVGKLEDVAEAMKGVEVGSRGLWEDDEDIESSDSTDLETESEG
jgi:hypothetical protein